METIKDVIFDRGKVHFISSREIVYSYPLTPRLKQATEEQRNNWRLIGVGRAVEWPDVDEHLSLEGMNREDKGDEGNIRSVPWREADSPDPEGGA